MLKTQQVLQKQQNALPVLQTNMSLPLHRKWMLWSAIYFTMTRLYIRQVYNHMKDS